MKLQGSVSFAMVGGVLLGDIVDDGTVSVDDETLALILSAWSLSGGRVRVCVEVLDHLQPETPWAVLIASAMDAWDVVLPEVQKRGTLLALSKRLLAEEKAVMRAKEKLEMKLAEMKLVDESRRHPRGAAARGLPA